MPRNAGGVGRGWFGLALGSLIAGVAIGLLGRGLADYWAELVLRASKILGCPQVIGLQAGLVEPRVWSQVGSIGLWATRSKGWGESKFGPRVHGLDGCRPGYFAGCRAGWTEVALGLVSGPSQDGLSR